MTIWTLICPTCGTENQVGTAEIVVDCGKVSCACTCSNCRTYFESTEEYWRWLGLEQDPQDDGTFERTG